MIRSIQTDSPLGVLSIYASQKGITEITWQERRIEKTTPPQKEADLFLEAAAAQLDEYFRRRRTTFDLPLDMRGTDFQTQVWKMLLRIPYGETRSYGEIARDIGDPKASRAVGLANGKNPIPIVVPCHRVIGSNGKLTGFAGGLHRKALLLELECGLLS